MAGALMAAVPAWTKLLAPLALNFSLTRSLHPLTDHARASFTVHVYLRLVGAGWEDSPLKAFNQTRSVFSVKQHASLRIDQSIGLSG